jgi:hypothetical protein
LLLPEVALRETVDELRDDEEEPDEVYPLEDVLLLGLTAVGLL